MNKNLLISFLILFISLNCLSQSTFEVFISNSAGNSAKRFDAQGNFIDDFVTSGQGGLSGTQDLLFLSDGSLLASGIQNNTVKRFSGSDGSFIEDFTKGFVLAGGAAKMRVGPDSLLYVSQWFGTYKVARFDLNGNFVSEFTSIGISTALGMDWDKYGNLYVAQFGMNGNGVVKKFDTSGVFQGDFVNSSILQGPTDLWFDKNGDLLVEDWITGHIRRYDSTGNFINNWASGLGQPEGFLQLPDKSYLIPDWLSDRIVQLDSTGSFIGTWASGNGLNDPNGITMRSVDVSTISEKKLDDINLNLYKLSGSEKWYLSFEIEKSQNLDIRIISTQGRSTIISDYQYYKAGKHNLEIPTDNLSSGVYFVKIHNDKEIKTKKFILN